MFAYHFFKNTLMEKTIDLKFHLITENRTPQLIKTELPIMNATGIKEMDAIHETFHHKVAILNELYGDTKVIISLSGYLNGTKIKEKFNSLYAFDEYYVNELKTSQPLPTKIKSAFF